MGKLPETPFFVQLSRFRAAGTDSLKSPIWRFIPLGGG
jgi:hypothetical protein